MSSDEPQLPKGEEAERLQRVSARAALLECHELLAKLPAQDREPVLAFLCRWWGRAFDPQR